MVHAAQMVRWPSFGNDGSPTCAYYTEGGLRPMYISTSSITSRVNNPFPNPCDTSGRTTVRLGSEHATRRQRIAAHR